MKIKTKILLAFGYFIALAAGYLIGIPGNYAGNRQDKVSGTFGKVAKFHKSEMTEKDIELRSNLLQDTTKLKEFISTLTYFSLFTERVGNTIDESLIGFIGTGLGTQPGETESVNALKDYADFIRNNDNMLETTISLLSGFYLNKSDESTMDIEKTMNDFGAYFSGLKQRDNVVTKVLENMSKIIDNRIALNAHEYDIKQLKSMRDQLVIKAIQLAALTGNLKTINDLVRFSCSKGENPGEIREISIRSNNQTNAQTADSNGKLLSYNTNALKFSVVKVKDYSPAILGNTGVILIAQMDHDKANVLLPEYSENEISFMLNRCQFKEYQKSTSNQVSGNTSNMSNLGGISSNMSNFCSNLSNMSNFCSNLSNMSNLGYP